MQCMIKPHKRLIIWMMLVSEDNASGNKNKKVKKLHSALFYSACRRPVTKRHNGAKVYFNKRIVWETGKWTSLATPGVTLLSQFLPSGVCSMIHRKDSSSTLLPGPYCPAVKSLVPEGGKGQAQKQSPNTCSFFSPHKTLLPFFTFQVQQVGCPGYVVPISPHVRVPGQWETQNI